jgi:hypothetical protein
MNNWLQEFRRLFEEATERRTTAKQRLNEVEEAVANVRSTLNIDQMTLKSIEESNAWTYPWFWPKMSEISDLNISVPGDLSNEEARHNLISECYKKLKHIEVVSVILRFIYPEEFGIMSPPVISFLRISPLPNNVAYYEMYLEVLKKLKNHYELKRIADADMAIWSASYLCSDPDYSAISEDMRNDEYYQRLLFENTIQGWGSLTRQIKIDHMLFAEAFVKHDYFISSLIAARIYEEMLWKLGIKWGVETGAKKIDQSKSGALKDRIKKRQEELAKLGVSSGRLDQWWIWRNESIHSQISKKNAHQFVSEISKLHSAVLELK